MVHYAKVNITAEIPTQKSKHPDIYSAWITLTADPYICISKEVPDAYIFHGNGTTVACVYSLGSLKNIFQ